MDRRYKGKDGQAKGESIRLGAMRDPEGLAGMAEKYLEWMAVGNYSVRTIQNRRVHLGYFFEWCEERGLTRPIEITRPVIERYQRYLFHYRKVNGDPLPPRTQRTRLTPIRTFFKWLARNHHIMYNPASELELPRAEFRLPPHVLTASEAEMILNMPDIGHPIGVRDRAILETLYSTGIRRLEVINLSVYDLDPERGTLMIRQGKGKKDRVAPIGERAIKWIHKYLYEARPSLVVPPDHGALFLTAKGTPFGEHRLTEIVGNYIARSECGKKGACHLFRHSMATLMLENGADLRTIQEILGHANLATTQIYTHVSIRRLKEVHNLTHPANMKPAKAKAVRRELEAELTEELPEVPRRGSHYAALEAAPPSGRTKEV